MWSFWEATSVILEKGMATHFSRNPMQEEPGGL